MGLMACRLGMGGVEGAVVGPSPRERQGGVAAGVGPCGLACPAEVAAVGAPLCRDWQPQAAEVAVGAPLCWGWLSQAVGEEGAAAPCQGWCSQAAGEEGARYQGRRRPGVAAAGAAAAGPLCWGWQPPTAGMARVAVAAPGAAAASPAPGVKQGIPAAGGGAVAAVAAAPRVRQAKSLCPAAVAAGLLLLPLPPLCRPPQALLLRCWPVGP